MDEKIYRATYVNPSDGEELEYSYWTDISALNKSMLVRTVVELVVNDGFYDGLLRDVFFKQAIIAAFTDVEMGVPDENSTSKMINTSTIEKVESFVEQSGIAETVMANMKPGVLSSIIKSIDENIEYKTGVQQHGLEKSLTELIERLTEKVNAMDVGSLNDVLGKVAAMQGDFTPEKVLDAYMSTDMFKENAAKRVEISKKNAEHIMEIVSDSGATVPKKK